MRLIDADKLKINLYHNKKVVLNDDLVKCIDDTETSYDIDKVVEKLEERKQEYLGGFVLHENNELYGVACGLGDAIEIVKQEAEQFNNGWIPCSEPPENDRYVLLSFENFSVPMVGRYEEDENGGAFYVGDDDKSCVSQDIFVNAWMNLPAPYKPKGEIDECRNG